ncbi:MAG: hydroxymethylglutaryl-CoA lyase [Bdellovibrionales bacterium]|nr:hydroxymethylglutaryl-CoA lyase [Bdellovibrionales bacterium]
MRDTVLIREVGPREGFQSLERVVDTRKKLKLIELLVQAGMAEIEVCSFVRGDRVPQMADAEDIASALVAQASVQFRGLYLNERGFERACSFPSLINDGWLYTAMSQTFLRKNANSSFEKFLESLGGWLDCFERASKKLHGLMISTVFGCNDEGRFTEDQVCEVVERTLEKLHEHGAPSPIELSLADTMGWASPVRVTHLCSSLAKRFPELELSLHLHDTRGLGIASAFAGLKAGVRIFESSVGGIGGCPFAKGATGNIATEELVLLCQEEGLSTGIDRTKLLEAARFLEVEVGIDLPSRLYRCEKALSELNDEE